MRKTESSYPIDNSAILFLAQMGEDHTNVYRCITVMREPVCPKALQQAADRICPRFPTILAGFRPGVLDYRVVPASRPPQVREDPGLLETMGTDELAACAYRIYYQDCSIIIEAFHSLTDGYGAMLSLQALLAEYLYLRYGLNTSERQSILEARPDWEGELGDAYLSYAGEKTASLPRAYSYQLPAPEGERRIHTTLEKIPSQALRNAARRCGVSVTALLSALMAESVMEVQQRHEGGRGKKPVRIMVPMDLRRRFPSRTVRNFVLYALPTLTPQEAALPRAQRLPMWQAQLNRQMEPAFLAGQMTRNVKLQRNPLYRALPLPLKCLLLRLIYRFFGESNSSITLTNLGALSLSEEMQAQICRIEVHLTPRRSSPYNCGLLTCGDTTYISISRYGTQEELEPLFFNKLRSLIAEPK